MRIHRPAWRLIAVAFVIFVIGLGAIIILLPLMPAVTRYVEDPKFRVALEQETAKGLHFPSTKFAPIHRTGRLTAHSDSFQAHAGWKAMTSLEAHGISATFNPAGVFLRRWQLDSLQIDRAEIGIHVYEPKPEPLPSKPWYHVFLPDRVYLKRVWSDNADVTWQNRGATAGIFKTHLVVTPHGRDFNYHASTGTLKNPPMPDLAVQEIDLLITKKSFTLYTLDLKSGNGAIHAEGDANIADEKRADFSFKWNDVPIREWLPKDQRESFGGNATGDLHWNGNDYKLAAATMTGGVNVKGGRVSDLKLLDAIAAVTKRNDLARLDLDECKSKVKWKEGDCELNDIAIEQDNKFRIEGSVSFNKRSLGGTLELGLAPDYLTWLPHPEEVFPRKHGHYLWTTVHLSGTLDAPQQDLSPRLLAALKESPGALLGAALRALKEWLQE